MRILGINSSLAFARRPRKDEEQGLRLSVNQAYKAMGTTDRVVITHGSCFPAVGRNSFIGSPFGNGAKEWINFIMLYGFNANQLGPIGTIEPFGKDKKYSPYGASAFAKNRLFIDLKDLTTDDYGKILSKDTFLRITKSPDINELNFDLTNYEKASSIYDVALKECFENYKRKAAFNNPEILKLDNEFQDFKIKNNKRLTDEALFQVLSKKYDTDDFEKWDDIDSNLLVDNSENSKNYYYHLKRKYSTNIEQYKFEQFLITKQIKENKKWRDEKGFEYINDLLVGCSKMDEWRYKTAFLKDYTIGAFEGDGNHQLWNLPIIDPNKIFVGADMKLAQGGKFLKEKIDFALEFCENVRIDHVMGLVEPFLIKKGTKNGSYMSETYLDNGKKLDDYYNYPRILEKIILPSLKEHGLKPADVVWEDICSNPPLFNEIYYRKLNLPKLYSLEWAKSENANQENWFIIGSHDSIPVQNMLKRDWTRHSDAWNPLYLAGYLNQDVSRAGNRDDFCKKIAVNDAERVKAKFAELLTNKKFQISFADLLGITDITYNIGGSKNDINWKERISVDFLDKYYENLSSENPTALNIPEILKMALQAKIDMKITNSENPEITRAELYAEYQTLLDDLEKYANILKEP